MSEVIINTFPQVNRINDPILQSKVVSCWNEALRRGGWTTDDLEKIPFTLIFQDCRISLATHTRAVTECSLALGQVLHQSYAGQIKIDFDILTAGALLHDVGKLLEYRRVDGKFVTSEGGRILRHPISGCALAAELGLPETVQHIIAAHSHEGDKGHRTAEAYIVHHSDFVNFDPLKDR